MKYFSTKLYPDVLTGESCHEANSRGYDLIQIGFGGEYIIAFGIR